MKPETCDKCDSTDIGGLEYAVGNKYRYDGVSEWICINCSKRVGKWCGQELIDNMIEPPFCNGGGHPRVFNL